VQTADGRDISIINQPMANGGWVSTHEDITERRKAEAKIAHMALHDGLTGLPNRLFLSKQIESRIKSLAREETCAVHFLDLDRFKNVNDTLGHSCGDRLLRMVADRMTACLRQGDTLARLGGDEFAVLQNSPQS
jgi:diguanylate cyclase (GGDEF)-like protein